MRWPGWHVVVQSSHDGHVTSDGAQIPWAIWVHSNKGSGHNLGCDKGGPLGMIGHGWD